MVDGFPYTWGDRGEWVASRERKWQNVPLPELEAIKSLACYDDNNYSRHKATTLCVTGNERHGIFSEQHQREKKVTCPFTSSVCSWFVLSAVPEVVWNQTCMQKSCSHVWPLQGLCLFVKALSCFVLRENTKKYYSCAQLKRCQKRVKSSTNSSLILSLRLR